MLRCLTWILMNGSERFYFLHATLWLYTPWNHMPHAYSLFAHSFQLLTKSFITKNYCFTLFTFQSKYWIGDSFNGLYAEWVKEPVCINSDDQNDKFEKKIFNSLTLSVSSKHKQFFCSSAEPKKTRSPNRQIISLKIISAESFYNVYTLCVRNSSLTDKRRT